MLEAGAEQPIDRQVDDERGFLGQSARLARPAHRRGRMARRPRLREPAGPALQDRGRHHHAPGGRRLALSAPRRRAPAEHGATEGDDLLDRRVTAEGMERLSAPAEDELGAARTDAIPGLPGGDFDVLRSGAIERGPEKADTGRAAIDPHPRDARTPCRQLGFCFRGRKKGRQVVRDLLRAAPRTTATGHLDLRPEAAALRILHGDSGRMTGVLCADRDGGQRAAAAAVAGNSTESPRRLLDSASSMDSDGLVKASGQA